MYVHICVYLNTVNRRKRDILYTRWITDQETSPFILKVLEEDITTPKSKTVAAFNILSPMNNIDKIIGFPIVSTSTTNSDVGAFNDYTRFVPLSTIASENETDLKKILIEKINQIRPKALPSAFIRPSPKHGTLTAATKNRQLVPGLLSYSRLAFPTSTSIDKHGNLPNRHAYTNYGNKKGLYPIRPSATTTDDECDHEHDKDDGLPTRTTPITNNIPDRTDYDKPNFRNDFQSKSDDSSYNSWFYDDDDEDDFNSDDKFWDNFEKNEAHNTTRFVVHRRVSGGAQKNASLSSKTCSLISIRPVNYNRVWTLPEILVQLKKWAEESPIAKWVDITLNNFTTMDNSIYMMIVDDPSSGQIVGAKETVMIVAGVQGRDHYAVAAAMHVLYQLIEKSETHTDVLSKYRFWVIPVFNPDGYDYSVTFPKKRDWTKNLRQNWEECKDKKFCENCEQFGLRCVLQSCYGVHLDRNFEYQWISSMGENSCDELYAGPRQLSEPETKALTTFLELESTKPTTFIAFKEGNIWGVMFPHSHTRNRRPLDHVYRQRAQKAATAAYSLYSRPYVSGQTSDFLPLYAGGIEDWMEGHLGVDNSYTIMIHRSTESSSLNIERTIQEVFAATDTLVLQSMHVPDPPMTRRKFKNENSKLIALPNIILASVAFGRLV